MGYTWAIMGLNRALAHPARSIVIAGVPASANRGSIIQIKHGSILF